MRSLAVAACLLLSISATSLAIQPTMAAKQTMSAMVATAPGYLLATPKGMTMYIFTNDSKSTSQCYGKCAAVWSPVLLTKGMMVPASLPGVVGTFGISMRTGGATQLTYDGSPLYTFAFDKKAGQKNGQGIGGVWWTVVVARGMMAPKMGSLAKVLKPMAASVLVSGGKTLYLSAKDAKNASHCVKGCAMAWLPVTVAAGSMAPMLKGAMGTFSTAMRSDGTTQLTYDGAPLYGFVADKQPGAIAGQGVGDVWWVMSI